MTIDDWMNEVRRLTIAIEPSYAQGGLTHEVSLEHRSRPNEIERGGVYKPPTYRPPTWVAKCSLHRIEGATADEVMRRLVEALHDRLVDKIEKSKQAVAALEAALDRSA